MNQSQASKSRAKLARKKRMRLKRQCAKLRVAGDELRDAILYFNHVITDHPHVKTAMQNWDRLTLDA